MNMMRDNLLSGQVSERICYNGDEIHPMGWGICKADTVNYELSCDNILYLSDTSFGEFQSRLTYQWDCDFENPVVIEARVKVEKCENIGGCGIFVGDRKVCELLTLFSNRVEFANSIESYEMDTTDDFHEYKIEIKSGKVVLYVDGKKVLFSVLKKASCRNHIGFGGFGTPGSGWWDYFKFEYSRIKPIVGGSVVFDDFNVVRKDRSPLNFSFAKRFSDNTIWLEHSIGQHMQDERKESLWSLDNGKIWTDAEIEIKTLDTCELPDGSVISLDFWDAEVKKNHSGTLTRWSSPRSSAESEPVDIELPFSAGLLLHRSMIMLKNGRLLAVAYGHSEQDIPGAITFLFFSDDAGKTWDYLSKIPGKSPGTEGFCEPCLLELENGDVICLMRTGGSLGEWDRRENAGPLVQSKSTDGGKTWTLPVEIANYGVNPDAIRLSDGTLVATAGRPGLYILVDFTGTGESWQQMKLYNGPGSSYASLMEVEPGKVILLYDESSFCLDEGPGMFNRIVSVEMNISKNS